MNIKRFLVGWLSTNCYVVSCEETKEAVVIDPGIEGEREAEEILDFIKEKGLKIKYIINTHGHPDHTAGNTIIKEETGASILIHENDASRVHADRKLLDGDVLLVGFLKLVVLHTPGHTKGGISLLGDNVVFTGDTLFSGAIGRTDFPGGSHQELIQSIRSKLLPLPDAVEVYPGHESPTTIGNEKKYNPFLQM
jgi:hydroxyacylglutathione hydrolase